MLILTSSCGTAHDAAAYALREWFAVWNPNVSVHVEHVLEAASSVTRGGMHLYNWIQRTAPWIHQIYWRLLEFERLVKPGSFLFGRRYVYRLLKRFRPTLVISTHPHTNLGHFDLVKRVLGENVACVICCTELDGGFGFTRNWVSRRADLFWAITEEVALEACQRGLSPDRVRVLGPLLYPDFQSIAASQPVEEDLPLLVLATGANGANNHVSMLDQLLPLAGRIRVSVLCGKRDDVFRDVAQWSAAHPQFSVEPRGFLGPKAMFELYRDAWVMVARPGARTATEALCVGCVLIFNTYATTMPQELLARRFFRSRQIEVAIKTPQDLLKQLQIWLEKPWLYQELRDRYNSARLTQDPELLRSQFGLVF